MNDISKAAPIAFLLVAACSANGIEIEGQTDQGGQSAWDAGRDASSTQLDMSSSSDVSAPDQRSADLSLDVARNDGGDQDSPDLPAPDLLAPDCDYQTVDDIVVIEAEDLPIVEDWSVSTTVPGFSGAGYIDWLGPSFNNDPTHGVMSVALRIDRPGRYRLQWHVRIGQGMNTTEHNDAFVRFPDADDFYGLKGAPGAEIRRYPKPQCDDPVFTGEKEALPEVDVADCVRSSSSDGWIKVYSSGADTWRWSTFTSDNDASAIMMEFDAAGIYTLELAARADRFLIDRLVVHLDTIEDAVVRDSSLATTQCP